MVHCKKKKKKKKEERDRKWGRGGIWGGGGGRGEQGKGHVGVGSGRIEQKMTVTTCSPFTRCTDVQHWVGATTTYRLNTAHCTLQKTQTFVTVLYTLLTSLQQNSGLSRRRYNDGT